MPRNIDTCKPDNDLVAHFEAHVLDHEIANRLGGRDNQPLLGHGRNRGAETSNAAASRRRPEAAPCCMDRGCGRTEPYPCSGLSDADVLRASQLQHSVQHVGRNGHVWTTAPVQGKNGRSATWSGAVMCPASNDAVRMTAGHDAFHGSGPNHLAAQFVPWPSRVFPIPA